MYNQTFIIVLIFLLSVSGFKTVYGQAISKNNIKRNLKIDSDILSLNLAQTKSPEINPNIKEKKSSFLAGVLSAVLPGAGEFYAKRYLKAGILIAVEAAAITTYKIYYQKGDHQTSFFQDYANLHWSAARYAQWTINNSKYINPSVDPSQYHVFYSNGSVNWSELNRLENDLGGGYSHQLAPFGTQDYYEIIGKYPQFSHGWDSSIQTDTDFHILTQQFLWYAHQRGLANSYYTTGTTALIAIYINHFLSILDAVWSTHNYNNSIAMSFRIDDSNMLGDINLIPTLNFSYNF